MPPLSVGFWLNSTQGSPRARVADWTDWTKYVIFNLPGFIGPDRRLRPLQKFLHPPSERRLRRVTLALSEVPVPVPDQGITFINYIFICFIESLSFITDI